MTARTSLPLRLHTTRKSMLLLLLGCIAFVIASVAVLPVKPAVAYSGIVFFGLGAVVALLHLLPNSSYLELDERGFTTCTMFRKSFVPWDDIAEFFPISLDTRARPMVALRYAPGYTRHATARKFVTAVAGAEGALPDTYGRSAKELAELLNRVRAERCRAPGLSASR